MSSSAPAAVTANPYLTQYSQLMSGWGGDPYAAYMAQNSQVPGQLQTEQQQLLGNGGFGYVAGSGNDQTGSSYGNSLFAQNNPMPSNPWALGGTSPTQSTGQGFWDPSQEWAPQGANMAGYNGLQLVAGIGPQDYMSTADEIPQQTAMANAGEPGYFEGQNWVNSPSTPSSTTPGGTGTIAAQSSYPTYSNQYGLGTGTGTSTASTSSGGVATPQPNSGAPQVPGAAFMTMGPGGGVGTPTVPTSTPQTGQLDASQPLNATTGFNPWSLQGEANSVKL